MVASFPTSKAGTRSPKPIEFLALMVGAEKPSIALWARPIKPWLVLSGLRRQSPHHGARRRRDRCSRRARNGRRTRFSAGEAHDLALKIAETDGTKRAFATFGKPFGLALYRNGKTVLSAPSAAQKQTDAGHRVNLPPDDTTPIPRPSRYYGRPQDLVTRDRARLHKLGTQPSMDASLVPASGSDLLPHRIDQSVLTIAEPKRLRDKPHLRFVASQPCLICGRQPSDPHHLRFAQPRAIGLKVSDEFTVPLCRGHHRQLHQASNEMAWWEESRYQRARDRKEPLEANAPNIFVFGCGHRSTQMKMLPSTTTKI